MALNLNSGATATGVGNGYRGQQQRQAMADWPARGPWDGPAAAPSAAGRTGDGDRQGTVATQLHRRRAGSRAVQPPRTDSAQGRDPHADLRDWAGDRAAHHGAVLGPPGPRWYQPAQGAVLDGLGDLSRAVPRRLRHENQ